MNLEQKHQLLQCCPAYRLDCVVCETLEEILSQRLGQAFHTYRSAQEKKIEADCAACYERGRGLAAQRPEGWERFTQEDFLAPMGRNSQPLRSAWEGLSNVPPQGMLWLYQSATADRADFEAMYSVVLGYQDGLRETENLCFTAYLEEVMLPDESYDCTWYAAE